MSTPRLADYVAPPVLLLHGFGSSFDHGWRRTGWVDVLDDAGLTAVGGDLLGHGVGPHPADIEAYAAFEDHALSLAGDTDVVDAIGFSLGGLTVLRLAADHPDRFRRLVVMGVGDPVLGLAPPRADIPLPDVLGVLDGVGHPSDSTSAVFDRLVRAPHADRDALAAVIRRPTSPLTLADLHAIECPVLLVIGSDDFAGPATRVAEELPDARVVDLPRTDHFATASSMTAMEAALAFLHD